MKLNYELGAASYKLMNELFKVQPGESVAITCDTLSSMETVEAIAQAVHILGGKPLVLKQASPRGYGKAGDPDMAIEALIGAIKNCDIWIECNEQWLLYSTVHDIIEYADPNHRPRYMMLGGVTPEVLIRNIGKVNLSNLAAFLEKMGPATFAGKDFHFTTPAGSDITFTNYPGRVGSIATGKLVGEKNGRSMMPGQISWSPDHDTINGVLVIDGSMSPPVGLFQHPVKFTLEKGMIVNIEGEGSEAKRMADWFESFKNPAMYRCVHLAYGFGPNAILEGNILEDERVWGAIEWGFGNMVPKLGVPNGYPAPSHCDGISLNASLWMDGVQILDEGRVVGPTNEIVDLARKLHI